MKTDEQIRAHVMRRVRTIYWARQLARPAPRVVLLAALGTGLVSSVSVANIAMNLLSMQGISQLSYFGLSAFANTTPWVQALFTAFVGMVGWFSFDGIKTARYALLPPHTEAATAQ